MLKITVLDKIDGGVSLKLEGKVSGRWVQQLKQCSDDVLAQGLALRLDLRDVLYMDRPGSVLLRGLIRRGVLVEHPTVFAVEQLKEPCYAELDERV